MKVFGVAAVSALLVAMAAWAMPARAQMETPHINLLADTPSKTQEEIERDQAKDKAYKESLKKIPDAKGANDPWGTVRSDAPKDASKSAPAKSTSAARKTKTGSNAPN